MKSCYEYTENKKVKFYRSSIDEQIYFPYTFSKKENCWVNRTCELSRQRINQLENEGKVTWM